MIKIDYAKCCFKDGQCANCDCVEACPVGALTRENIVKIDNSKCLDCGACVSACEHGAISMI